MQKTILVTGATDGIGLATASDLVSRGHHVLVHGRNRTKLDGVVQDLSIRPEDGRVTAYQADLSKLSEVEALAEAIAADHETIDVVINNAGVLKTPNTVTADNLDVRFAVNTIAPYLLTKRLMPLLGSDGRVINLSSAAQAPVSLAELATAGNLSDMEAYSQSKLAITMWSRVMGLELGDGGPAIIAVNPGSLLASKMVKDGFGIAGNDISIGSGILVRAALDDTFASATARYFDNDAGDFGPPHPDALDDAKSRAVVSRIEEVLENAGHPV